MELLIHTINEYRSALSKLSLLRNFPQFDNYHKLALKYFAYLERKRDLDSTRISMRKLAQELRVPISTLQRWINGSQPKIIKMLEYRLAHAEEAKAQVLRIYAMNNGIHSFSELQQRLKQLVIYPYLQEWENLTNHHTAAQRYFIALELFKQGYLSVEISRELGLSSQYAQQWLLFKKRPLLVKLAGSIPIQPPKPGYGWLPLHTKASYCFSDFLQVPKRITHFKQLFPIIRELSNQNLKKGDKKQTSFGELKTFRNYVEAFAYLIGVTVSDAHIEQTSLLSSCFKLVLSKKYSWTGEMGDRVCYYFGNFGLVVKNAKEQTKDSQSRPNEHLWTSESLPIFSWFKQAVLGLFPYEVKTYTPVRMEWILHVPKYFKKSFLQGLCDGDGSVTVASGTIKIIASPNQELILDLLRTLNVVGTIDGINVNIASMKGVNRLIRLPIFISAKSRLADATRLFKINQMKSSTSNITPLRIIRRVLELAAKPDILIGDIRYQIAEEFRVNLRYSTIQRIICNGKRRLVINQCVIDAYFELLERSLTSRMPLAQLIRDVRKKYMCQKAEHTMYHWIRKRVIPRDVKAILSDGYKVHDNLLQHFPHLHPFIRSSRS